MSSQLSDILEKACRESGLPAAAGIVVSHDSVIAQAAVGVRKLGVDSPVTIADKFHSGSNAKAMTATMIAALVHQRLLRWESTPLDLFPELTDEIIPEYRTITLDMLLRHRAGIPPYTDDEAEDYVVPDLEQVNDELQIAFFSKWVLQNRLPVNEPGTEFLYSNAGYSIATAMAEAASGKSWRDLLEKVLFQPLGIDAVAGCGWPGLYSPDQPWGHLVQNQEVIPHDPEGEYQLEPFLSPAGDVCISIPDYGRFLQMNLNGLEGNETILPSELIKRMHNDGKPGYGLGWGVTVLKTLEQLGPFSTHAGSAGTFILAAAISHDRDRAVAFATNVGKVETLQLVFKEIIAHFVDDK